MPTEDPWIPVAGKNPPMLYPFLVCDRRNPEPFVYAAYRTHSGWKVLGTNTLLRGEVTHYTAMPYWPATHDTGKFNVVGP